MIGSGGILVIVVPTLAVIWVQHQQNLRAREGARSAEITRRREVYATLQASLREWGAEISTIRAKHDHWLQRWVSVSSSTKQRWEQKFDEISRALARTSSELILDQDSEKLRKAAEEFLLATNEYIQPMRKAMYNPIGKVDTIKLTRLAEAMDAKMEALEEAGRSYVSAVDLPLATSSWVKRAIKAPVSWLQGIISKQKATSGPEVR
jgi:hypothetical protein